MSTLEMSRLEMFTLGLENYGGRGGAFHSAHLSISQCFQSEHLQFEHFKFEHFKFEHFQS